MLVGFWFGDGGPDTRYWTDTWDGFPAARDRLTQALAALKPANPVVLSGDYHSFWTNDVRLDSADPSSAVVATEFVGTSITSTGPSYDGLMSAMPNNPQVKFFDSRVRGYMAIDVTPERMTTRYRSISDVRASLATAPWISGTVPLTVTADGGGLNSAQEEVLVTVASAAITTGRSLLWVQGLADNGEWGAPSALFVNVVEAGGEPVTHCAAPNCLWAPQINSAPPE